MNFDGTPITSRKETLVVPRLVVNIVSEYRYHGFIRLFVEMMNPIALIEQVG